MECNYSFRIHLNHTITANDNGHPLPIGGEGKDLQEVEYLDLSLDVDCNGGLIGADELVGHLFGCID
jgi:hypothetical protein